MGLVEFIMLNRWLITVWLLPLSFVYDIFWALRAKYVLWRGSCPKKHQERVEYVQKQVNHPNNSLKSLTASLIDKFPDRLVY